MKRQQARDETGQPGALTPSRGLTDGLVLAVVAIASAACIFVLAVMFHGPTHAIELRASTAQLEAAEGNGLPDVMSSRCASAAPKAAE